jgi:hypothetical protein
MVQPAAEAVGLAFKEPAWREVAVTDGIAGVLRPLDINVADLIGPPLPKSGVKFSAFTRIWLKTAHVRAKFMQHSIRVAQSGLQPSSGFNL